MRNAGDFLWKCVKNNLSLSFSHRVSIFSLNFHILFSFSKCQKILLYLGYTHIFKNKTNILLKQGFRRDKCTAEGLLVNAYICTTITAILGHFHHPQKKLDSLQLLHSKLPYLHSHTWATINLLSDCICPFWTSHRNGILKCGVSGDWLLSLSIMLSRITHIASMFHSFPFLNWSQIS